MEKYIGIPYESKGRSFEGCDCYGLLQLFYANELKVLLQAYAETYSNAENLESASAALLDNRNDWVKIESANIQKYDAILFKVKGYAAHVGVVVDPLRKEFIHTLAGHDSAIDCWGRARWNKRIEGFYRHNSCL